MDVLADLLERAHAHGGAFASSTLSAPWGLGLPASLPLSVHVVAHGTAWLIVDGEQPLFLDSGDVVLVASSLPHRLADHPARECISLEDADRHRLPGTSSSYVLPGEGETTRLLCGAYQFHGDICGSLLAALPSVVHLTSEDSAPLTSLVQLLASEITSDAPGRSTILDRLLDVLLVCVLRVWFARPDSHAPRWYLALNDLEVGRALGLIHGEPAQRWTVAALGGRVGLSRSAFARRFSSLVGEPPLTYLTRWRMQLAAETLRDTKLTVAAVARSVGYDNEFAFSVAFRRHHGTPPTVFRSRQRAAA